MSHAALALILERGRAVTRRVLVASSPCISQWNLPPNSDTKFMYMHVSLIPSMAQIGCLLSATDTLEGVVVVAVAAVWNPHRSSTGLVLATDSSEPGTFKWQCTLFEPTTFYTSIFRDPAAACATATGCGRNYFS